MNPLKNFLSRFARHTQEGKFSGNEKQELEKTLEKQEFEADYSCLAESIKRYMKKIDSLKSEKESISVNFWKDHEINYVNGEILRKTIEKLSLEINLLDEKIFNLFFASEIIMRIQENIKNLCSSSESEYENKALKFYTSRKTSDEGPIGLKAYARDFIDKTIGSPVSFPKEIRKGQILKTWDEASSRGVSAAMSCKLQAL